MSKIPGFTAEASLTNTPAAHQEAASVAPPGVDVTPAARELDCTGLPDGEYPNVDNCDTFYRCTGGQVYLYNCPAQTKFDAPTGRCEVAHLARCAED